MAHGEVRLMAQWASHLLSLLDRGMRVMFGVLLSQEIKYP